jgi:hypothetical protein
MLVSAMLVLALHVPLAVQDPPRVPATPQSTAAPAMRELKDGESAIEGLLQRVECPRGRPVRFTMRVGDKVERFEAARLADVEYIAHTPDFRGPMTCGGRGDGDRVRMTWRKDGEVRRAVALEFLPAKSAPTLSAACLPPRARSPAS